MTPAQIRELEMRLRDQARIFGDSGVGNLAAKAADALAEYVRKEEEGVWVPMEPPIQELVRAFGDWMGHNRWIDATTLDTWWRRAMRVVAIDAARSAEKE